MRKKKVYEVFCEVDMCAERTVKLYVVTTKPQRAVILAEKECYARGHFFAKAYSVKESESY